MDEPMNKQEQSDQLKAQMEEFLSRGGEVKEYRDCSAKEAYFRSSKPLRDPDNPNRILRRRRKILNVGPAVFSGYNSGKG
jgi:hypothetical protein